MNIICHTVDIFADGCKILTCPSWQLPNFCCVAFRAQSGPALLIDGKSRNVHTMALIVVAYTFDFIVDEEMRKAFSHYWSDALELYKSLHKLALLNDLAIPRKARNRMDRAVKERRFAARLPEPQQENMVFAVEEVRFWPSAGGSNAVDYVSLSDGEHQQALILGIYAMVEDANALFLLDEPESHFNPQWRVKFVKRLMDLRGARSSQELLLTTHAPFVASDMRRDQVLVFDRENDRITATPPEIETYGASYDRILAHCFKIRPPISQIANDEIGNLLKNGSIEELKNAMSRLGESVEKTHLASRLRKLTSKEN